MLEHPHKSSVQFLETRLYIRGEEVLMKEKIIATCAELKDLIDGIGTIQTATGLIVSGTLIVLFVLCVLGFCVLWYSKKM